jgi:TolB protein
MKKLLLLLSIVITALSFKSADEPISEKHFKNIKQLTFGGDNAEAYFSFNNKMLTFQKTNPSEEIMCDQIYTMDITDNNKEFKIFPVSNGEGRSTCSYFMPGNKNIVFASTHAASKDCPQQPTPPTWAAHKYLWGVYNNFDIYTSTINGNNMNVLTASPGYDAEATVSPKGDKIVFTSSRNGDLDLYIMDIDGKNIKQVTNLLGYDGGAFFSPDGKKLVFRASRPQTEQEIKEYKELLSMGLVAPTNMELYTINIDGSDLKQITKLGKANWAPFYHPSGKKIIFSSNHKATPESRGYNFQLYMINEDGTGLEQITTESNFNAFPMFSFDGKKLVFSSNRNNNGTKDTNLFLVDWVE